ncbi:MAG: hypothetical protein A3K19_24500 [Lentisphaerae bacterium RIFOXYB12_FULL_65_16]|nr:MAG: hypothetical protein A3K18_18210 [Lentisphaerae bacterium RIFOXYA12_64_32]OGV88544.1 MAG: hypothetical protein A3K19_24500 [Lentisphaerae bacterium RIFOXYB12_FULL_65_16]
MIYWDTSCVLKLYTPEADSEAFLQRADDTELPLLSSDVLRAEVYFALCQKEIRGEIKVGSAEPLFGKFEADVTGGRFLLLPVGRDVLATARDVARQCYRRRPVVALRALDGIHLASAVLGRADGIVTVDARMREASDVLGLHVLPPRVES